MISLYPTAFPVERKTARRLFKGLVCLLALSLTACATVGEFGRPRPQEGLSNDYPAPYDATFAMAESVLREMEIDVSQSDSSQGFILGSGDTSRLQGFEGLTSSTRKLVGSKVLMRADVTKVTPQETKVQIVARKESMLLPGDTMKAERDFMDNMRNKMSKLAEQTQVAKTAAQAADKGAGAAALEAALPPSDVDFPPSLKIKPKPNAYAVIVGIENYRDLPKVDYATRDAETVKQYLVNALGFQEEHVIVRTNDRATRSDLESYFERWLKNNVEKDAEVFVFYAGHGAPDPKSGQSYLVPFDGNPSFLETTAYPVSRLYESLAALPAKQIVVALDSCFSGSGGRSVIAKGARPMMLTADTSLPAGKNLIVFSAAAGNEISSAFQEKRHGLFTYFFLKGLRGEADTNKDGAVEIGELFTYLKPQVEKQARRTNQDQTPQLNPPLNALKDKSGIKLVESR